MRLALVALMAIASSGCLVTTTAPPLEPGVSSLPQANVAAREGIVINQLTMVKQAEDMYYATRGTWGSMDELVAAGGLNISPQQLGYTIELTVAGDGYSVIAVPMEYGPKGKRSFYMDQTGIVRGDDHMGGAPSATDPVA